MTKEQIINLTDKLLESVPGIRERIRLIDVALNKDTYNMDTVEKLKQERYKLNTKLSRIIKAIGTLEDENQRIICYRYFEKLTYKEIGLRVGLSDQVIKRRVKKNLLVIGRVIYGMEEEFWSKLSE